jgi:glycosyltransferase involved in cell wall biosynthesis
LIGVRVAVDTLFLSEQFRHTGTGTYLRHLASEWLRIAEAEFPDTEFHGFQTPNRDFHGLKSPLLHVHTARCLAGKRFWILGGMAYHVRKIHPDLLFLPTAHHSLAGGIVPVVTTILDAIPKRLSKSMNGSSVRSQAMTWINAKRARRVITISEWSKRDLIEIYRISPDKIDVTYLAYNSHWFNPTPPDPQRSNEELSRLGVRRPYVLHHGRLELRKNLQRLIKAWDNIVASHPDAQLVLAGGTGHGSQEIMKTWQASASRRQIVLTGALTDEQLSLLVKNASLCVVPSLYEGFCLPMLEAMACGVPTVVSKSSCLPEVSGGVLEYFDPRSVEEMGQTIQRVLEDSDLRQRLRHRGLIRATEFSWERCARQTLRAFNRALDENRPNA